MPPQFPVQVQNAAGSLINPSTSDDQTNGTQKAQRVDASGNVTPAGDTTARAVFMRLGDGTTAATIKPASTAAASTDTAVVVSLSPNNLTIVSTKTPLTANSPATATVGVTSAQALAANSARKGLVIFNESANTVSIGIGATAVLSSGITLFPGGVWFMDEYTMTTAAINAIASAASSAISIQEFQ